MPCPRCQLLLSVRDQLIRIGSGPQVMTTVRNIAIGLLQLAGHTNIATALRYHSRDFNRPVELVLTC